MGEWTMAAASGATASAGTEVAALVICGTMGAGLVAIGRAQRRSGRNMFLPEGPFRFGGTLLQPPGPTRTRRVAGRFFVGAGWVLIALGLLNGLVALTDALS
jgi:hypothetical protein